MNDLFDRYALEVIPLKRSRTRKDNIAELKFLRPVFGHMRPQDFRAHHGYAYYAKRAAKSLACANKELALLSHTLTKGVEWGVIERNFCKEIRKHRPPPRERYVSDCEFEAAKCVMPQMQAVAMELKLLTGLRPGDVLGLTRKNLNDEGILVTPSKPRRARFDGSVSVGKSLLIEWSPDLRQAADDALKLPPRFRQAIICNRAGRNYTVSGFNSIWYRHMRKAVADPNNALTEPFQFRDLRAKSATDDSPEAATARLQHSDPKLTARVYRRGVDRVRPLR